MPSGTVGGLAARVVAHASVERAAHIRQITAEWCSIAERDGERIIFHHWPGVEEGMAPRLLCAPSKGRLKKLLEARAKSSPAEDAVSGRPVADSGSSQDVLLVTEHGVGSQEDADSTGITQAPAGESQNGKVGDASSWGWAATPAEQWTWHRDSRLTAKAVKSLQPVAKVVTPAEQWAWHRNSGSSGPRLLPPPTPAQAKPGDQLEQVTTTTMTVTDVE
mmetsp:Transcript_38959/g.113848  ORF Transcript_38959/g.113848 Transcript_38959/m.113848 type:complete len:219 (+) Transcript_38959:68-724(+)